MIIQMPKYPARKTTLSLLANGRTVCVCPPARTVCGHTSVFIKVIASSADDARQLTYLRCGLPKKSLSPRSRPPGPQWIFEAEGEGETTNFFCGGEVWEMEV